VPAEPRLPSRLALWVLVATAVLAPWPYGAVQPRARLALSVVCLLAASIALLIGFVQGELARPRLGLWPLLGFVGLGLVQLAPLPRPLLGLVAPGSSAVWYPASGAAAAVLGPGPRPVSLDPDTTLRATALVAGLGLLAWIAAPALTRAATASRAVALVTAGGFCLSAYAIYARARFGVLLYGEVAVPTVRPFGSFVSKNHFAGYVELAALLAAGLALGLVRRERESGRDWTTGSGAGGVIAAMVAALAMALAVIASLSRGGAISLAAGSLALLALLLSRSPRARSRARVTGAVGLATALGVLLVVLAPPEAQERMRSLKGASLRLDTWRDTLRMAAASPVVGQGLGAFHDAYPRFKRDHGLLRVEHSENDYLETLAESGILGLGLAAAGGVLLLGRREPAPASPLVRGIGLGAVAGLVALAVHSTVDFNLRIPSNAALAAVLAAAAAAAAGPGPRPLSRAASLGMGLSGLALLLAVALASRPDPLRAREEAQQVNAAATVQARRLRLERAEAALVGVLRRRPAHAESWLMLAGVRGAMGDRAAAAELARHALALDPEWPALRTAASPLLAGPASGYP
jgi:O-antigen ligase